MAKAVNLKCEPDSEEFDELECAKHLAARMFQFQNPMGLSAYWYQKKVQARLQRMPDSWRDELNRRYYQRLDALIEQGPQQTNEK